jgi:hypothetical protein
MIHYLLAWQSTATRNNLSQAFFAIFVLVAVQGSVTPSV